MQSGKQRRAAIKAARLRRAERRQQLLALALSPAAPWPASAPLLDQATVERSLLAADNSYGAPAFVQRGYYQDVAFTCVDCGEPGVWSAARQKWWYEVARGGVWTTARRCRSCRAARRAQRELGRLTWQQGQQRKAAAAAVAAANLHGARP